MSSNTAKNKVHNFKVVLLGEGCVGKTSVIIRYVEERFDEKHVSTLQAAFKSKRLNLNGTRVNLSLWDTAGQERFHALGPIYYRDADGAVLLYDVTDEDSFTRVKNWVKELRTMLGHDICMCIVGNKVDLERSRVVAAEDAEQYAKSVGAKHYLTSAKLNKGIQELFSDLTQWMVEKAKEKEGVKSTSAFSANTVQVLESEEEPAVGTTFPCCG
ncbi:unnamed protein product [Notodromas monacha]|uniref:Ras-related protein Rab-21 n=1 Tax=Notodromas monacha TaxID=399045 RepID=A0A7R9BL80_9CRUS|nr:unnamed protein product [Notodromas monacha]CAG0916450.1 unnamed protein product [Notodromas monacha]